MNPLLLTDFYKIHHFRQYPENMINLYSSFIARKSRMPGVDSIIWFGLQHFILEYLIKKFNEEFFGTHERELNKVVGLDRTRQIKEFKNKIIDEYKRHCPVDTKHIEALWDLGFLPIKIKALPEGKQITALFKIF